MCGWKLVKITAIWQALTCIGNLIIIDSGTLPAKSMEYSENTMETLSLDITIYCKWHQPQINVVILM